MTSETTNKNPVLCKIGIHNYEDWVDHNFNLNRGCVKCGKVQMMWGTGWHDWADGWTYSKAKAMSQAYKQGVSAKERLRIMREVE